MTDHHVVIHFHGSQKNKVGCTNSQTIVNKAQLLETKFGVLKWDAYKPLNMGKDDGGILEDRQSRDGGIQQLGDGWCTLGCEFEMAIMNRSHG